MKASLELKVGQRLSMTPQLQQAIRLLQMSSLDLATEIQEVLDANPMLEEFDPRADSVDIAPSGVDNVEALDPRTTGTERDARTDEQINSDRLVDDSPLDYEATYDPPVAPVQRNSDSDPGEFESRDEMPASLQDYLREQISALHLTQVDRYIAHIIIGCIDDGGYLGASVEELVDITNESLELDSAHTELAVGVEDIKVVLKHVQNLDPAGIGARDLKECLCIQLQRITTEESLDDNEAARDDLRIARLIVSKHLDDLANRNFDNVRKVLDIDTDQLRNALGVIQRLDARPGTQLSSTTADYIIPDVIVRRGKTGWVANLNTRNLPHVRVNDEYAALIKRGNAKADNDFLKEHLNEARFFIKSLHNRHDTLLRVADEIVKRQHEFFDAGDQAMKPMVLADIAVALDLHESTISRATTQKYMLTPRGVFELKYFFSSGITNASGDAHSATAIRSMIRKLIEDEPRNKPVSDSKIASALAGQGVKVARRTVAKYREAMNIPPSNLRKEVH